MILIHDRSGAVELDEFLARPLFAHIATVLDGAPRDSPVWFLWEDEAIWIIASRATDTFPDRIEREPRCAIGIVDFDPACGLVQHVGFRGRATVEPFDAERAVRRRTRPPSGPSHPSHATAAPVIRRLPRPRCTRRR
jgi:hypothetical protein